ncbi:hypothetical protein C8J56DRAFT_93712 [Mycena floridula]|nr:hypothetical protein C8J56DRAFT_93712 [Mycena floridula]
MSFPVFTVFFIAVVFVFGNLFVIRNSTPRHLNRPQRSLRRLLSQPPSSQTALRSVYATAALHVVKGDNLDLELLDSSLFRSAFSSFCLYICFTTSPTFSSLSHLCCPVINNIEDYARLGPLVDRGSRHRALRSVWCLGEKRLQGSVSRFGILI